MQETTLSADSYRFVKVEDFFTGYQDWEHVGKVTSHSPNMSQKTLELTVQLSTGNTSLLLLRFIRHDTFRIRFNPCKKTAHDYQNQHGRSIVMNTVDELCNCMPNFSTEIKEENNCISISTKDCTNTTHLKVIIHKDPFFLEVYHYSDSQPSTALRQTLPSIFLKKHNISGNGRTEYAIIQRFFKTPSSRYFGFGENPGRSLCKNGKQLTYFNYDNMRSKQIYGRGPMEDREPLYHSNTFFMEFNRQEKSSGVTGIFVDNVSETFVDVGQQNHQHMVFGSWLGDLDYYCIFGSNGAEVLSAYTSLVGHTRLKPRWALGYHQGCYGYESRDDLMKVANDYRLHSFPIDGLHIDVDIQIKYQTFTINTIKFPNPKAMFSELKQMGLKCSTNITPIISNQDGSYQIYQDAFHQGLLLKDQRSRNYTNTKESHQHYSNGHDYSFTDNNNPRLNTEQPYEGKVYYGEGLENLGCYPDLGRKDVRHWWGEQYRYIYEMGISMIWQDMTSPAIHESKGDMKSFPFDLLLTDDSIRKYSHHGDIDQGAPYHRSPSIKIRNLYSYNLHKATYHGLNHLNIDGRENERNFIIGRGGFTGMHRFAALWTGDNASQWDFYRINVAQVLALGISGQPLIGQDTGGFEKGEDWEDWCDPQLYIRWMCTSSLLPWFRNHYKGYKKGGKIFQEPYQFQYYKNQVPADQHYLYESVLPITRYYVGLRYRLMQLFYDAMFENTLTGMPIVRPLFFNDPNDQALFNDRLEFLDNQFFIRKDLLIAPITHTQSEENGFGRRDIYLPAGSNWYAFMDNRKKLGSIVTGGTTILGYDARIDGNHTQIPFTVPIYIRAGAIVPTIEQEQFVGERNNRGEENPITLNIYPGDSGYYTMYLDDGISRDSAWTDSNNPGVDPKAKDKFRKVEIKHETIDNSPLKRQISITHLQQGYTPKETYYYIAVIHDPSCIEGDKCPITSITLNDKHLAKLDKNSPENRAERLAAYDQNAYYYNENINISFIKVFDNAAMVSTIITYAR